MIFCQRLGPDHTDEGVCMPSQLLLAMNEPWLTLWPFKQTLSFLHFEFSKPPDRSVGSEQSNKLPPVCMYYRHTWMAGLGKVSKNIKMMQEFLHL